MVASKKNATRQRRARLPVVFLVDDEPLLLDLLELALMRDGYRLRKFLDPELALQAFLKARPKPDVLVTDYALGKMNGLELIEQCKLAKPDLHVVMVSGTASAEIALRAPDRVDRFLGKPYQPATLSDMVRAVLTKP